MPGKLAQGAGAHRREQRIAEPADRVIGVGLAGGDADLRKGLLHRPRHQREIVEIVVVPVMRAHRLGPGLADDIEAFGEAVLALFIRDAVGVVGAREGAAADPEDKSAAADLVDRRGLLGEPQRMTERQDLHGGADLDAVGARGDRARHGQRRRQ